MIPIAAGEAAPEIFRPVLKRLSVDARTLYGADAAIRPLAWQSRPFSTVLKLAVEGRNSQSPVCCFAKVFKPKDLPDALAHMRQRVVHEFDTTAAVHRALSGNGLFGTLRPVACYPDLLAMVTQEVKGSTLLHYLEQRLSWFPTHAAVQDAERVVGRVGGWLRAFQTMAPGADDVDMGALGAYVDVRLERLVTSGRSYVTAPVRHALLDHLARLADAVPAPDRREVLVHADLAPGNIIVHGDRITVLDFAMCGRGTRLHDLTRLALQVEMMAGKPRFRARVLASVAHALLTGFDASLRPTDPLYRLSSVVHRVNNLATTTLHPGRFPASLYSRHIKQMHERWLAEELRRPVRKPVS